MTLCGSLPSEEDELLLLPLYYVGDEKKCTGTERLNQGNGTWKVTRVDEEGETEMGDGCIEYLTEGRYGVRIDYM